MNDYNNKFGYVTNVGLDYIEIDNVKYSTTTPSAAERKSVARPTNGDRVEFNFNIINMEIIYLRNMDKSKKPHYSKYRGPYGYVEDPRDPDEIHDMALVYGSDFEGM